MLSVVLAALVAVGTLATASTTLAHQASRVESAREVTGGPPRGEIGDPAPSAVGTPGEDRPARSDGAADWRMISGPTGFLAWLVVALVGLAAPRRRRFVAWVFVAALVGLAFEAGVHSVHHLGDEAGASRCSVASASTHLFGTPEDGPAVGLPVVVADATPSFQTVPVSSPPFRPDAGRAPPASLTV